MTTTYINQDESEEKRTVAPMWKTLGISMTIAMFVVLVFGIIAGVVAIDQSHEMTMRNVSNSSFIPPRNPAVTTTNEMWRAAQIEEQKNHELGLKTPEKEADAKPEISIVHPKADREFAKAQVDKAIECYDDDSSIVYRTTRCEMKRHIDGLKNTLKKNQMLKTYKDAKDGSKNGEKKQISHAADRELANAEAMFEYAETL